MTSNSNQALIGILVALICASFILGSAALSLIESGSINIPISTSTRWTGPRLIPTQPSISPTPVVVEVTVTAPEIAHTAVAVAPPETQFLPTMAINTPACGPPPGWIAYSIRGGDTLASLGIQYGVTPELLAWNNCLVIDTIIPGTILYIPYQLAQVESPPVVVNLPGIDEQPGSQPVINKPRCGAPSGWVKYRVQRGDTLFALSQLLNVTVKQLQQANCLGSSTLIRTGQTLFVPYLPVRPIKPTPIPSDAPTEPLPTEPIEETSPAETTTVPPSEDPLPSETTTVTPPSSVSAKLRWLARNLHHQYLWIWYIQRNFNENNGSIHNAST